MKWQVVIEAEIPGGGDFVEARVDDLMEHLVDSGVDDPTVGASLASGVVEIEFVVEAPTLLLAQEEARSLLYKTWGRPLGDEIVGESTRRTLVPA